jgi:hypothetical protein
LADKNQDPKHYALIFGTAYGPDSRPFYGASVYIHPVGKKRPAWELMSDHQGEFAQRVPPGPADYVVTGQAEIPFPEGRKKIRIKAEKTVHIDAEERQDISLQLTK